MPTDLARYHRQMLLPGFGEKGQQRLAASTALLLGCGALGSVIADLLARAGVGHLIIVDRDIVEITNLQRQVLFDEADVAAGMPKAEAARKKLAAINSDVSITAIVDDINAGNLERFSAGADVLVDGLDNFETRYLANDVAVKLGLPYVYGAAVGTTGMAMPILPHTVDGHAAWEAGERSFATPCFRCLFDQAPPPGTSPTCDTVGVVSAAVGLVANFQVMETLKILTGNFDRVCRTLLSVDLWANELLQLSVDKAREQGDCPACKHRRFDFLDAQAGSQTAVLCGREAVQLRHRASNDRVDLAAVASRLEPYGDVRVGEFLLQADISDGGNRYEISLFPDGRAIVKGTDDAAIARKVYAKYIGH
ncbi:MAG: ThiF family adenylyltransferase [Pseudomonadota bacterium]